MSRPPDAPRHDEAPLAPDDARLLARVREAYAPAPRSVWQRSAFDARLRERLERARAGRGRRAALAGALAAAGLAALLVVRAQGPDEPGPAAPHPPIARAPSAPDVPGAASALLADPLAEDAFDVADELPPQYAAIAGAFLE